MGKLGGPTGYVAPRAYQWNPALERIGRVVIAVKSICPSLERLQNGDLLSSLYAWTPVEGGMGRAVKVTRSRDGGATWSEPLVVAGPPSYEGVTCHLGLTQLSDGTILLPFSASPSSTGGSSAPRSTWIIRSEDNGQTWEKPVRVHPDGMAPDSGLRDSCAYGKIRELSDGKLLLPAFTNVTADGQSVTGYFSSPDLGKTWDRFVPVAKELGNETDYIRLPGGKLLAVMRPWSHEGHGTAPLYWCYSEDGERWSQPRPAWNMFGHSPSLFLTKKGHLLCGYRYVGDLDTGLCGVSFSYGKWDDSVNTIEWSFPHHIWLGSTYGHIGAYKSSICGYPTFSYVDSDRILCAYWMSWTVKPEGGVDTPVLSGWPYERQAHDVEGVFFRET